MRRLITIILALALCLDVAAQSNIWDYDADFEYYFDNREFDYRHTNYTTSMTINAARLTPWVGVRIPQKNFVTHSLRLGVDLKRNMGEQLDAASAIGDLLFYYNVDARLRRGRISGTFGLYPRKMSEGEYSYAFMSDSLRFFDNNLEGMLMKWRSPRLYAEIGCDWMGMYGQNRRERFKIFSSGSWKLEDGLSAGWAAVMYHYAGSAGQPGVVDNHLLNPYIRYDFSNSTWLDELSLKFGGLLSYQWDRLEDEGCLPMGAEIEFNMLYRKLGLRNTLYVGDDLMPYYSRVRYGKKYGSELYSGSPFYSGGRGYDRLEFFWAPQISAWLRLNVSMVFHFTDEMQPFSGWQQKVSLIFDLDSYRHPEASYNAAGRNQERHNYRKKSYSGRKYSL
jgi:hypothetical protein